MAWGEGEVLERRIRRDRVYALRFMAYGERRYITLGRRSDGWDRRAAEEELQNVLADVRRGFWVPPDRARPGRVAPGQEQVICEVPRFGTFASGIVASRRGQVSESTTKNEVWALTHLNPYFAEWPLDEIDAEAVDDYRLHKVRESEDRARAIERGRPRRNDHGQVLRPLSPRTINKTIDTLAWLLGIALDYRHVSENAASGRKRRLKAPPRRPVHLDAPAQIEALLDAGAELDRDTRRHCIEREVILTALILAGPRAEELCQLLWRDVDLANERISVGRSKTQAGLREIPIRPLLHRALVAHKAVSKKAAPDDLVFPHVNGGRRDRNSLRSGVLVDAFARADEILINRGPVPLPVGLSAHKLRHSFASLLVACGEDPVSVMRQLGHTDPGFTLRVYTHMMVRSPEERERLKGLVRGERAAPPPSPRPLDGSLYEQAICGCSPNAAAPHRGEKSSRPSVRLSRLGTDRPTSTSYLADRHVGSRGLERRGPVSSDAAGSRPRVGLPTGGSPMSVWPGPAGPVACSYVATGRRAFATEWLPIDGRENPDREEPRSPSPRRSAGRPPASPPTR